VPLSVQLPSPAKLTGRPTRGRAATANAGVAERLGAERVERDPQVGLAYDERAAAVPAS
jgi:hypothetical protein